MNGYVRGKNTRANDQQTELEGPLIKEKLTVVLKSLSNNKTSGTDSLGVGFLKVI